MALSLKSSIGLRWVDKRSKSKSAELGSNTSRVTRSTNLKLSFEYQQFRFRVSFKYLLHCFNHCDCFSSPGS
jgi:hypothetical protein